LFYSTACAFDPNIFSSAGGAFYSVQNRCQPPLLPLSIHSTEAPTGSNHHPVDRRAFYTPDSALQPLF
ncbi:hypothetical protein ACIGFL_17550, partial [Pseudomonas sp. NPDC077649]|uniref:hypothetical protein n=1 Tax=Pseudomonas sp. NPDC077649 TaxID=3364423 RepID=UPI0037C57023